MGREVDVLDLVARARRGEHRAVARLIALGESGGAGAVGGALAAALAPYLGRAHVVGLTGPPGVGKSTVTSVLVTALRGRGRRVGVLAVDPSSPFSGGALLGDRVRMGEHATDDGVFIRSMASRGHLGGLARSTPHALRVLDAAGCDVVLVETVGVGQSEVEVAALADTTVVVLAPGLGDGVQAAKAGILEVADVLAVNKADRPGAPRTVRELEHGLALSAGTAGTGTGAAAGGGWTCPVVSTVAVRAGGVDALLAALDAHRGWLDRTGERGRRRRARAAAEIGAIALERLRSALDDLPAAAGLAARVAAGALDPHRAAERLLAALGVAGVDGAAAVGEPDEPGRGGGPEGPESVGGRS